MFTKIAHEIKTPLTLIKGPMDKIMKFIDQMPQAAKNLKIMNRNTDRLFELTKQILDFRKIESSQLSLHFVNVDICKLIYDIVSDFQEEIESGQKRLSIHTNQSESKIEADTDSVKKIITNLIANAIKYGDSILTISITSTEEENIQIKFSNDGPHVPLQSQKEIFKPFIRLNKNDNAGGTGIGLSLARSLAELHNGTLEFMIENSLNTFVLILPTHQKQ